MSHTYLPLLEEKKLGLKLGDVLSNYLEPKIEYSKYNYSLRKFIYLKINKKKNIRNFIIQNLNFFIPKSYIEDFALIKSLSIKNKHYPPNPKFIFTSNLYATDEVFKIYAASKVQEKTKYIIGQHGNSYFTKIFSNYLPEIKTCDIFFSWGFKKKPKIISTFNFKVLGKNFKKKKKTNFLIVLHHFKEINHDIASNSLLKYFDFKNLLKALKKLKPEIRKHTTIRMPKYLPNKFNINFSKYLNKLDIEIDNGNDNLDKVMKETKLCLFNYDSTGFLENTLIDVPSLILENKFYLNSINKSYLPRYKKLCSNKIMFTDPEKVVSHINLNWDNIEFWWSKNKIKDTINFFNKNLNISPTDKNCTKQLLKYLKNKLK